MRCLSHNLAYNLFPWHSYSKASKRRIDASENNPIISGSLRKRPKIYLYNVAEGESKNLIISST